MILLVAAWVINTLVVKQARQQVQTEVENVLPVYNAVWEETARSLSAIGTTMANAPITKMVFGDRRAAQDRQTLHEMIVDLSSETTSQVDLILISDGGGKVSFAEWKGQDVKPLPDLAAAREVAESQKQAQGFAMFGEKLYQLALTPILLQSASAEYHNTLGVLGTAAEINRDFAQRIKQRLHSDVVFFVSPEIYTSSFPPQVEKNLAALIAAPVSKDAAATKPFEVKVDGHLHLAFSRQLVGVDGTDLGRVVVFRSLDEAGKLFRSISNVLLLLWSLSILAAFVLSYLLAERITRPIAALIHTTREVGKGNYSEETPTVTHGELGELAQAFDHMQRSLKQTQNELLKRERLAAIGQMASSIVHDLRNPLATIATAAEMLNRDGLALDRRKTLIGSQLRAAQRMQEMLSEMLDFTRGTYRLDLEHYRLAEIVEKALQSLPLPHHHVSIETSIPPDLWVTVDGERLRRVFENLLSNAWQALPAEGPECKITVRAEPQSTHLRIDVIDTGPGVPTEIQDRLFEPFVSYGKHGGTGLGLAISRSIIEAHGGSIGLMPAPGCGADFYVLLPTEPPLF